MPHFGLVSLFVVSAELPAGASDARREALMAAVSLAMSTGSSGTEAVCAFKKYLWELLN